MEHKLRACILSQNKDVLYNIRRQLMSIGITAQNAINYYEVINFIEINHIQVLFIDTTSIIVNDDFLMLFQQSDSKFHIPNIVLLMEQEFSYEKDYPFIHIENFYDELNYMMPTLLTNAFNFYQNKNPYSTKQIGSFLISIGLSSNLAGYIYLRDCIHYLVNKNMPMFYMSKTVYKSLSKMYNKTICSIEKDLRYVIKKYVSQNNLLEGCMSTKKAVIYLANKFWTSANS